MYSLGWGESIETYQDVTCSFVDVSSCRKQTGRSEAGNKDKEFVFIVFKGMI